MLSTAEIGAYGQAIDSLTTLAQNDLHALWSHVARQRPQTPAIFYSKSCPPS